jgi:hypothetical protein
MSAVDVLDYTQATAAHHGRLLAHVRRSGSPRAAHDLIIAAHAAETGRMIMSRDAKARFGDLPGVSAIDVLYPCTEVVGHHHLKPSRAVSCDNQLADRRLRPAVGLPLSGASQPRRVGGLALLSRVSTRRRCSPGSSTRRRALAVS